MKRTWIVAAALTLLGAYPAAARVWPIKGMVSEPRSETIPRMYIGPNAAVGHVPSQRNLLRLERAHPMALPTAASAAAPKTVRVAVLRVQFKEETPDNAATTGNGRMDLRDPATFFAEEHHMIEMSPHNRLFFEQVMRGMAKYYEVVSNGLLTVEYEVFPKALDSAYTVDSTMSWYGSRHPNEGLADLLIDAVKKADTDDSLVFADFDAFMIFHAGSDRQHDFSPITPTPYDLYTGYVRLLDPSLFVSVDNGASQVGDAVILPESATQDNRGTGLGGLVAHEFGHQLGLVDIYSTRTGTTQVGDFSLMDNDAQEVGFQLGDETWNPATFFDILPVYPDAWSRAYLGFVTPKVVLPDSMLARGHMNPDSVRPYIVSVAASETPSSQVLKVPISAKEYYLVEFRSPDWDTNKDPDWDPAGAGLRVDSNFNVILGVTLCGDPRIPDSCRVFGRDYDLQLPIDTGGMLIWHVDESVAYDLVSQFEGDPYLKNNYDANTLQWDRNRRFLEIEEADGLVDFGGNYYTGFGSQRELFLGGYVSEFGPTTNPSTRSHTGAPSHLRFYDISPIFPLPPHHMKVKITRDNAAAGWPRASGKSNSPELTIVRGTTMDTVLASAGRYVLGWDGVGTPLITQLAGDRATDSTLLYDLETVRVDTLTAFARAGAVLATAPSVGSYTVAGDRAAAAVDVNGRLYIWSFTDTVGGADGWADSLLYFDLTGVAPRAPLWHDRDGDGDDELVVITSSGIPYLWDNGVLSVYPALSGVTTDWVMVQPSGDIYAAGAFGLVDPFANPKVYLALMNRTIESVVAVDDDRDGVDELFAHDGNQLYRFEFDPDLRFGISNDPAIPLSGPIAAGDYDGDGTPSLYVASGDRMAVFEPSLVLAANTPYRSDDVVPGEPLSQAIVLENLSVFGAGDGEVQAYISGGDIADGWPFFAGDTVQSVAAVQSGTDSVVVLARSSNGYVWGTKIAANSDPAGGWLQSRASAAKQNRWDATGVVTPSPDPGNLTAGSVFAYPNPANRGPVTIRYYVGSASQVELTIYDLAGNEVTRATVAAVAGADNEWTWDASQVAPGVYFCRVHALSGGDAATEFCKVAITP